MKIANLTSHKINLLHKDKGYIEIEPSGYVVRVKEVIKCLGFRDGFEIIKRELDDNFVTYEDLKMLKKYAKEYDAVVVSLIAGKFIKKLYEKGLLSEDEVNKYYVLGELARDKDGNVIGADALCPVIYL